MKAVKLTGGTQALPQDGSRQLCGDLWLTHVSRHAYMYIYTQQAEERGRRQDEQTGRSWEIRDLGSGEEENRNITDLQERRHNLLCVLLPASKASVWGPCGLLHSENIHQIDITAIQRWCISLGAGGTVCAGDGAPCCCHRGLSERELLLLSSAQLMLPCFMSLFEFISWQFSLCFILNNTYWKDSNIFPLQESATKLHTYESNTLLKHLGQPKREDEATLKCCWCVYKTILVSHWCFDRACTINLHKDSIFAYINPTSRLLWIWFICSAYVYYCFLWFIFCVKYHQ